MKRLVQESLQKGLEFLTVNQSIEGRFTGLSSSSPASRQKLMTNDNVFFTALILSCLESIPAAKPIRAKAAHYLLGQRSEQWTWNYWDRKSTARPYPDDLDDMACAIIGIATHDSNAIDASAQARIARSLIACETRPGGPYRTWLTSSSDLEWRDIDIAVNANIGYMLKKLGVKSEALEDFIADSIITGKLTSPYYVGMVPVLYFIARWYEGSQKDTLAQLVATELKRYQPSLFLAMLVTAAYNLGCKKAVTATHISQLVKAQRYNGWAAHALYLEPPENGAWRYAGSPELTTAFVLEALSHYSRHDPVEQVASNKDPVDIHALYEEQIARMVAGNRLEVVDPAGIVARSIGKKLPAPIIKNLNQASIHGWVAYTTYDSILDGDASLANLGVANLAMRQSLATFGRALPKSSSFVRFTEAAFAAMDAANAWEVVHARSPKNLPDYHKLTQLADRSWGHVVAPTGALMAAGFLLSGREIKNFHSFMRHYLIAKQLCDDAHDWQEDLAHGHMTAVVVMLLRDSEYDSLEAHQLTFWRHTIFDINALVRRHVRKAQYYLDACYFLADSSELQAWLDGTEAVCRRAEIGHQAALQFIETFQSANLVK